MAVRSQSALVALVGTIVAGMLLSAARADSMSATPESLLAVVALADRPEAPASTPGDEGGSEAQVADSTAIPVAVADDAASRGPRPLSDIAAEPNLRLLSEPTDKQQESDRASQQLLTTDRLLASVRKKVARSYNKKAREDLQTALARQREARGAFNENLFARATRLTLESRDLGQAVAARLGPPQDDPDYVGTMLDRTDDALKRAQEVVRDAGSAPVHRRIEVLEERQHDARKLFKNGGIRAAYAATREVRDGVLTLLRECDDLPVPAATAERALKGAAASLERAKGELGERLTVNARRLEREARDQLAKARLAYARKNYRDTLLHSKLVERNLELAVAAQRGTTSRNG